MADNRPESMPEYVQKLRANVRVVMAGDEPVDGVLCLAPYARFHEGPQTLIELLNGGDRMVPLEMPDDGSVRLLTRTGIAWVAPHAGVEARLQRPSSHQVTNEEQVVVRLADGGQIEGLLQLELPSEFNRASDFLNLTADFFAVETADGVVFVNKLQVREVRLYSASPLPLDRG
jgi:hypothetical protein